MNKIKVYLSQIIMLLVCGVCPHLSPLHAVEPLPETDEAFQKRMQWFTDAKFGLFIHYGVYSILGGEWKGKSIKKYAEWIQRWGEITPEEYIPYASQFRPDKLDADAWVKRAKEAGMKYMVITTKHHDGFCLWDSRYTEYDLGESNDFSRDILGELKAACDKYGLQFGTYYSIIDWHHPSQRDAQARPHTPMRDKDGYVAYMKGQLKELIERYDPAIMWFDGDWANWWTLEDGMDLYNYLRELSPDMVINNRVAKRRAFKKDYGTPENFTPGAALDHIWEACWTVNHSWGFKKSDTNWKSEKVLMQKLIDINAKGGNLLLNVGPHADGSWPEKSIEQLAEMGRWNYAHEQAIYGAEFVPAVEPQWGRLTQAKGSHEEKGELFAYVFDWPENGELRVRGVSAGSVSASTYEGQSLPTKTVGDDIFVDVSSVEPDAYATVIRMQYDEGLKLSKVSYDLELKGDEIILKAANATLSEGRLKMDDNGICVGWKNGDTATWTMDVIAPGKFEVKLFYACEARRDANAIINIDRKVLRAKVPAKGKKDNLMIMDAGVIELNNVGTTKCSIRFAGLAGSMYLKTIYLVPVE